MGKRGGVVNPGELRWLLEQLRGGKLADSEDLVELAIVRVETALAIWQAREDYIADTEHEIHKALALADQIELRIFSDKHAGKFWTLCMARRLRHALHAAFSERQSWVMAKKACLDDILRRMSHESDDV